MVKLLAAGSAAEDTTLVELEGGLVGFDGDGNGALGEGSEHAAFIGTSVKPVRVTALAQVVLQVLEEPEPEV